MRARFGTQLRHLLELCETAVAQSYVDAGLDYIPRYTPIVRALLAREPLTVGEIAASAGMTQPAVTQTVTLMIKNGLLVARRGTKDARQRVIRLTRHARSILPKIEACWDATSRAHFELEREIGIPLGENLDRAIEALGAKPFATRISEARASHARKDSSK
jgi:MarR family transcriptional regulator, organic hydroperoxide resistance regulator